MSDGTTAHDPRAIRPASTLVLLRDGDAGPEVLMVRRARGMVFMADAHVFPGGRLDASDGGDHALAAVREAFEEAGVVLAVDEHGNFPATRGVGWIDPARAAVRDEIARFADVLAEHGLRVSSRDFVHFARWITPPTEARRFDAHFFLSRMPANQDARPDATKEVVSFRWGTPAAILDAQLAGELKLPPPTIWHLTDLARCRTVDEALAWGRTRVVYPVRPKLCLLDGVVTILLPWDPAYATAPVPLDDGEPLPKDHAVAGAVTRYELDGERWIATSR